MVLDLEKLNFKNYQDFAVDVAHEFFPIGTLVSGCGWYRDGFGIVSSISKTGKITAKVGKLPLEKVTDNEGSGGTYAKIWYIGDPKKFIPISKEELGLGSIYQLLARFSPSCYLGNDWDKKGYASPIRWERTGDYLYILSKPKVNDDGLIMVESYSS